VRCAILARGGESLASLVATNHAKSCQVVRPVDAIHTDFGEAVADSTQQAAARAWDIAVRIFNAELTKDDEKRVPLDSCPRINLQSFLDETSSAQKEAAASRSKSVQHISMLLERINTYSSSMDVLAQSSKETMLAWGAMRFLLHVILSEKHASEKLCQAITDVVDKLGRFQGYLELFPTNQRIIRQIGTLYAHILNLLIRATIHFEKSTPSK
jgi:hypothetical protein